MPKMKATLPIEGDNQKKLLLMEERFSRCVDFKEYNEEKKFEVKLNYPVMLSYDNLHW